MPIDSVFEQPNRDNSCKISHCREYIEDLKNRMMKTRQIVEEHVNKAKDRHRHHYNIKAKAVKVDIEDKVLVQVLAFEGKHKISDKFEKEMYNVIEQVKGCIPVYKVKGDMTGKIRSLHRNHLYLVRYRNDTDEKNS